MVLVGLEDVGFENLVGLGLVGYRFGWVLCCGLLRLDPLIL